MIETPNNQVPARGFMPRMEPYMELTDDELRILIQHHSKQFADTNKYVHALALDHFRGVLNFRVAEDAGLGTVDDV